VTYQATVETIMTYELPRRSDGTGCIVTIVLLLFVLLPLFSLVAWPSYKCDDLSKNTGKQTKWTITNGCLVKVGNSWVPEERWRVPNE